MGVANTSSFMLLDASFWHFNTTPTVKMLSRLRSAVTGFAGMRQDGDLKNSNIEESKRQPSKRFQATVTDKSEEKQVVTEEHLAERILPTDPSDQSKRPLANDFKKNQKPRNAQKPDITFVILGLISSDSG
jgi:hypothetical protein